MNVEVRARKKVMRARLLAARDALTPALHEKHSAKIAAKLCALPAFASAQTVAAYVSFGSEFETSAFLEMVLSGGKRLLLPRINKAQRQMQFHAVTNLQENLLTGVWGIREPDPSCCPLVGLETVDLILVPGVAFTPRCERLGYGGGFYDAAMGSVRAGATSVAAAFALQIVETIPLEPHDRKVDMVVSETGTRPCGLL